MLKLAKQQWHPLHSPLSCQMIKSPKAQQPPEHEGTATLSALHQYLLALLPGCNLSSFILLNVSLDLVTVADLFVLLIYPLCEGHVISLPEKGNALHFLRIVPMKIYLSAVSGASINTHSNELFFLMKGPHLYSVLSYSSLLCCFFLDWCNTSVRTSWAEFFAHRVSLNISINTISFYPYWYSQP